MSHNSFSLFSVCILIAGDVGDIVEEIKAYYCEILRSYYFEVNVYKIGVTSFINDTKNAIGGNPWYNGIWLDYTHIPLWTLPLRLTPRGPHINDLCSKYEVLLHVQTWFLYTPKFVNAWGYELQHWHTSAIWKICRSKALQVHTVFSKWILFHVFPF